MFVAAQNHWDMLINVCDNHPLRSELEFWLVQVENMNTKKLNEYKIPSTIVYSDASSFACGAYSVQLNNSIFHKMWSINEVDKSSTWREMKAISLALGCYSNTLSRQTIKWYTDSKNCVSIVEKGSMKKDLHDLSMNIFELCVKNQIDIDIHWIPRSENVIADDISKVFDFDDWGTSQEFFDFLNEMWGPFTVDRFASFNNFKCDRFYSKFWTPQCEGVDAFAFDWKDENNWIVPPIYLIGRVLKHIVACKAKGVMIVPKWTSSYFWPMIFKNGSTCNDCVIDALDLKYGQNFFVHGSDKNSVFGADTFNAKGAVHS